MGRILGIDWGKKIIGLALSDELKISSQPFLALKADEKIFDKLRKICQEEEVEKIVVGFPKTLRGEIGLQAKEVMKFAEKCEKELKIPVVFEDERFTSALTRTFLKEQKIKPKKKKEMKNIIEAQLILQTYLERLKNNGKNF